MIVLAVLIWTAGRALHITDLARKKLLESERAARAEVERASRLKDEFLATLSHELRTPLTAILGWSQLLAKRHNGPEDLAEGMETIARNARVQARIVEDLLDMSRIMTGKIPLIIAPMDLTTVIRAAIESVAPIAEAKHITINTSLNPGAGPFNGDAARLQQVIWNLLSKSVKFTPRGGIVGVFLNRDASHATITVTDNGRGIRADFLPHLFERFRQQDASTTRLHGGLGLGLSIAKQLVEFHGGTIFASSVGENQGATFTVNLPVPATHPSSETPIPSSADPAAEKINLTGLRILVVDDEPDTLDIVSRLLKDCYAEVITADSADAAMAMLRQRKPHVLISDISMPHRDGYDLINEIRHLSAEDGGKTPAVALTAFARTEDRAKAMQAGYQVHMSKPIEPQELIATIANLAGKNDGKAPR
jgi:CheY-like chemotaxis protein/nitrogen-specific signal transduction histidine kinase